MAYSCTNPFTMDAADATTIEPFRLVYVDSNGDAAFPNATTLAQVLAVVGATSDAVTDAGDIPVAGFHGGVHQIAVAASQTVEAGNPLYMTGTVGCVQTGSSGYLVGTALTGATSGASELAVISAVLHFPQTVEAET